MASRNMTRGIPIQHVVAAGQLLFIHMLYRSFIKLNRDNELSGQKSITISMSHKKSCAQFKFNVYMKRKKVPKNIIHPSNNSITIKQSNQKYIFY